MNGGLTVVFEDSIWGLNNFFPGCKSHFIYSNSLSVSRPFTTILQMFSGSFFFLRPNLFDRGGIGEEAGFLLSREESLVQDRIPGL